jgi:hypothetical protein
MPNVLQEIKRATGRVKGDARPNAELADRDHLHDLFMRLLPFVYDNPNLKIEEAVRAVDFRLTAAEAQYLHDKLFSARRKKAVASVSRGDEYVLLPLSSEFDPRRVPLAALWCDGGFYTAKDRNQSASPKLRKLGLPDGIAGYVSYRAVVLNPATGRPAWQADPEEVRVKSSFEAEILAIETGLNGLLAHLADERNLPPAHEFHVAVASDCQSLAELLKKEASPGELATVGRVRELAGLFAAVHPRWEPRRRIKRRLGH